MKPLLLLVIYQMQVQPCSVMRVREFKPLLRSDKYALFLKMSIRVRNLIKDVSEFKKE